jgi:hypothetical protein
MVTGEKRPGQLSRSLSWEAALGKVTENLWEEVAKDKVREPGEINSEP